MQSGDVDAALATLDLLCAQDISGDMLKIVAKDIMQRCNFTGFDNTSCLNAKAPEISFSH